MCQSDIKTILFDLDGTVIDHFRVIYRCYRHALDEMGLEPASFDKVKATVGGGIRVTFSRLVPAEYVEPGVKHWRAHYDRIWAEEIEVLSGAEELIQRLHESGRKVAIFTNKEGDSARKIADHLGWTPFLAGVFGRLDTEWVKPAPALTRHVLTQLDAEPATSIMVGDSPFDIEAGQSAGVRSFGVATGSHSMEELAKTTADGVFSNLTQLEDALFGDILRRVNV